MHRPKAPLRARRFGGFCRALRMWMRQREREMAEGITKIGAQLLLDSLHDRIAFTAKRAFEITILEERDGCVARSLDVIALRDGKRESSRVDGGGRFHEAPFRCCSSSSAVIKPAAPGFTPMGET